MTSTPVFTCRCAPTLRGSCLQLGFCSISQLLDQPPVHLGNSFKAGSLWQLLVVPDEGLSDR